MLIDGNYHTCVDLHCPTASTCHLDDSIESGRGISNENKAVCIEPDIGSSAIFTMGYNNTLLVVTDDTHHSLKLEVIDDGVTLELVRGANLLDLVDLFYLINEYDDWRLLTFANDGLFHDCPVGRLILRQLIIDLLPACCPISTFDYIIELEKGVSPDPEQIMEKIDHVIACGGR